MNNRIFLKILLFTIFLASLCNLICACSKKQYNDTVDCEYITDALQSKALAGEEYSTYAYEDISFILDEIEGFDSYSVIYSSSSDDIGEIGVFHAVSADKSADLLDDIAEYLSELKKEKISFVKNYLPEEQKKLDGATVKCFGNYVVFTVLDASQSKAVFAQIEQILE